MVKEDIAYCGLNCEICKERFKNIKDRPKELQEAIEVANFDEIAKVIPFMKSKYKGFKKIMDFFNNDECPGCREGGGNPFCGIRKCVTKKKGYFSCAECDDLCKRFNMLFRVHRDNEIQNNIKTIKEKGADTLVANHNERSTAKTE